VAVVVVVVVVELEGGATRVVLERRKAKATKDIKNELDGNEKRTLHQRKSVRRRELHTREMRMCVPAKPLRAAMMSAVPPLLVRAFTVSPPSDAVCSSSSRTILPWPSINTRAG